MKIETLSAVLENGTVVKVVKTTPPHPEHSHLDGLPTFRLEDGETLTARQGDTNSTKFITVRTRRLVTIVG
jgi:hypothetical protein